MTQDTCAASECDRPALIRGWCNGHYARWYNGRSVDGPLEKRRSAQGTCSVSECDRPVRARGYCVGHYDRWHTGRPVDGPLRPQNYDPLLPQSHNRGTRGLCAVEECDRPTQIRGLCDSHYERWRTGRSVDGPLQLPDHDAVGYQGAHNRVYRERGSARQYICVDCNQTALHWSYNYTDPDARTSPRGPFSLDSQHYSPRCVPCHKLFDQSNSPVTD